MLSRTSSNSSLRSRATTDHPLSDVASAASSDQPSSVPSKVTIQGQPPLPSQLQGVKSKPRSPLKPSQASLSPISASAPNVVPSLSQNGSSPSTTSGLAPGAATATSKLQFQTLQATVQSMNLRNESAGWNILLNLVNDHSTASDTNPLSSSSNKGKERERADKEYWERLVQLLETSQSGMYKIRLLLPYEALGNLQATPAFVASHVLVYAPPDPDGLQQVVTLTGQRGFIKDGSLVLVSCVSVDPTMDLQQQQNQEFLLGTPPCQKYTEDYPKFELTASPAILSVPRLQKTELAPKRHASSTTSRLASLFGGSASARSAIMPQQSNMPPLATTPDSSQSGPFNFSLDASSNASVSAEKNPLPLSIDVCYVDKMIRPSELVKPMKRALEKQIRQYMAQVLSQPDQPVHDDDPLPNVTWQQHAVPAMFAFAKLFYPPSSDWKPPTGAKRRFYDMQRGADSVEEIQAEVQHVYDRIRTTIKVEPLAPSSPVTTTADDSTTLLPQDEYDEELLIDKVVEAVECVLTDVLYDRLFSLAVSNDREEDEALSSRIAGLNLLELSLDHLGFDLELGQQDQFGAEEEQDGRTVRQREQLVQQVNALVADCGQELKKLEDPLRRSPIDKLDVLIQAHKIIVDCLSTMPEIPMKKEVDVSRPEGSSHELSDDVRSFSSRPASVLSSPHDEAVPEIKLSQPALQDLKDAQTETPPPKKTSSADLILPLLIYSVVQSNPHRLASHLAFIQRFHAESLFRGESMYCLVSTQAVLQFLLHLQVDSLGLNSDKILTEPDQITTSLSVTKNAARRPSIAAVPGAMRDKMSQELDSIAGHVSNTISGVAGVVGVLLTKTAAATNTPKTIDEVRTVLSGASGPASEKPTAVRNTFSSGLFKRPLISNTLQAVESGRSRSRSLFGFKPESVEKELQEVGADEPSLVAHSLPDEGKRTLTDRLASLTSFAGTTPPSEAPLIKEKEINAGRTFKSIFETRSTRSRSSSLSVDMSLSDKDKEKERPFPSMSTRLRSTGSSHAEASALASRSRTVVPIERFLTASSTDDLTIKDVGLLLEDYKRLAAALASLSTTVAVANLTIEEVPTP